MKAVGLHNAHNAGSAALIALALVDFGVSEESIQSVLPTLQPPPHRMEVGTWKLCVFIPRQYILEWMF